MKGKTPFREDDFRFKRREREPKPQIIAVVFLVMDQSGSMNQERIMIARAVCQYFLRWLRKKREYKDVVAVFIKQEGISEEVLEEQFFTRIGSGGTKFSTAWVLIDDLISKKYPPQRYNAYAIHFTDGENEGQDNPVGEKAMDVLLPRLNLFGYFQYKELASSNATWNTNVQKKRRNLKLIIVESATSVRSAIEEFLEEE